jgi:signal transduction histidine kinase
VSDDPIIRFDIRDDRDLVLARQYTRRICELLGFERQDQTRVATAVSEIARNALRYAKNGKIAFSVADGEPARLKMSVDDSGPGIADIDAVMNGSYVSRTGMGIGIVSARRLSDHFEFASGPDGTHVTLGKNLPPNTPRVEPRHIEYIRQELKGNDRSAVSNDAEEQSHELLATMTQLDRERAEIERLNSELAETNRGVLALYAEIDEKADSLRKASEEKSRFLSNMSHEFRTPLNSIISLSGILLAEADGALSAEQKKQVSFILGSARSLFEMVNDLLDIAKIEAGRLPLRPSQFAVSDSISALENLFASQVSGPIALTFEVVRDGKAYTDELKFSQIVRNFVSNALKYTEKGTVHVKADVDETMITIAVTDTGIGIAPENISRVFLEFTQIENPLQKRAKGTGLGLTLSRRLAHLLGGEIIVESVLGQGSTFTVRIPRVYEEKLPDAVAGAELSPPRRIVIVDDDASARYILRTLLPPAATTSETDDGRKALELIRHERPDVVFLDLVMPAISGFAVLRELRSSDFGKHTPVVLFTSKELTDDERHEARELRSVVLEKAMPHKEAVNTAIADAMRASAVT